MPDVQNMPTKSLLESETVGALSKLANWKTVKADIPLRKHLRSKAFRKHRHLLYRTALLAENMDHHHDEQHTML